MDNIKKLVDTKKLTHSHFGITVILLIILLVGLVAVFMNGVNINDILSFFS